MCLLTGAHGVDHGQINAVKFQDVIITRDRRRGAAFTALYTMHRAAQDALQMMSASSPSTVGSSFVPDLGSTVCRSAMGR